MFICACVSISRSYRFQPFCLFCRLRSRLTLVKLAFMLLSLHRSLLEITSTTERHLTTASGGSDVQLRGSFVAGSFAVHSDLSPATHRRQGPSRSWQRALAFDPIEAERQSSRFRKREQKTTDSCHSLLWLFLQNPYPRLIYLDQHFFSAGCLNEGKAK